MLWQWLRRPASCICTCIITCTVSARYVHRIEFTRVDELHIFTTTRDAGQWLGPSLRQLCKRRSFVRPSAGQHAREKLFFALRKHVERSQLQTATVTSQNRLVSHRQIARAVYRVVQFHAFRLLMQLHVGTVFTTLLTARPKVRSGSCYSAKASRSPQAGPRRYSSQYSSSRRCD